MVNVNNFGSYSLFDPPDQANFICFLIYVIKVDKTEVLRLYFKQIYVLLLVSVLPGIQSYSYAVRKNHFGSYPLFDPLDYAKFILFGHMSLKLIKEK